MLFSEPKIPQYAQVNIAQALNPSVSVLFSEPKIPQCARNAASIWRARVSVLFSEPKIPQSDAAVALDALTECFSALQRAENSSIGEPDVHIIAPALFQCSSASRKFLNKYQFARVLALAPGFSALQRAENSSMPCV